MLPEIVPLALPARIRFKLLAVAFVIEPDTVKLPPATTNALSPFSAITPCSWLLPAWLRTPVALLLTKKPIFAPSVTLLDKPIELTLPALVAIICLVPAPNALELAATTSPLLTLILAVKVFAPVSVTVPPLTTLTVPLPANRLPTV